MRPGESAPCALSGTIVVTVGPDRLGGFADAIQLTFAQDLRIEGHDGSLKPFPAPDLEFSFIQDPFTKDASILADNMGPGGACRRAETPRIFYPGRWFLGTRYDSRLNFGPGDFVHNTLLVTGQVPIETPVGAFLSWVTEITSESAQMGRITGIDWWTPELGAPACFETNARLPNGTIVYLQATLNRTNVIHDRVAPRERESA